MPCSYSAAVFLNRGSYSFIHIFLAGLEIPGGPPQIEETSEIAVGEPGGPDEPVGPVGPAGPVGPSGQSGPPQIEET